MRVSWLLLPVLGCLLFASSGEAQRKAQATGLQKPSGLLNPLGLLGGKPEGRPGGKPEGRPGGKPEGRPGGKPGFDPLKALAEAFNFPGKGGCNRWVSPKRRQGTPYKSQKNVRNHNLCRNMCRNDKECMGANYDKKVCLLFNTGDPDLKQKPGSKYLDCSGKSTSSGGKSCADTKCPENSVCKSRRRRAICSCKRGFTSSTDENGALSCTKTAICTASGDPHYTSFDGWTYDFMGTCVYTLSKVCKTTTKLPYYNVEAKNENRNGNKRVSYTTYVNIDLYDRRIRIGPGTLVQIGVTEGKGDSLKVKNMLKYNLPVGGIDGMPGVSITREGRFVSMQTDFGLKVNYDGKTQAQIIAPGAYSNSLCGICGNYNGNKNDDNVDASGKTINCANGNSRRCRNPAIGDSYQVADVDGAPGCKKTTEELPECPEEKAKAMNRKCAPMKDDSGPFKACLKVVEAEAVDELFNECVFDACISDKSDEEVCNAFGKFAKLCAGEDMDGWRETTKCPVECPTGMTFSYKASSCPNSCEDPESEDTCNEDDVEGCMCAAGTLLQGDKCVKPDECGCVNDMTGQSYSIAESYVSDNCRKKFTCQKDGTFKEANNGRCHNKASCKIIDGTRGCFCHPGFEGDGVRKCTKVNPCTEPEDSRNRHRCSENADCSVANRAPLGYKCECKKGFKGDGFDCEEETKPDDKPKKTCNKGEGGDNCDPCAIGSFKSKRNTNDECEPCAEGKTTKAEGAKSKGQCQCDKGRGGRKCEECAAGKYKDTISNGNCRACPGGMTTVETGADSKDACTCKPGFSGDKCKKCIKGTYKPEAGPRECTPCGEGLTTKRPGSSQASDCVGSGKIKCVSDCTGKPDGKYHSCGDCRVYTECTDGKAEQKRCPRPRNKRFFDSEKQACVRRSATCSKVERITCKEAKCPDNSRCRQKGKFYQCVCQKGFSSSTDEAGNLSCGKVAKCVASGDPHYTTFDGLAYDFMGICVYTLSKTCTTPPKLPEYNVEVKNQRRNGNNRVSFTTYVNIELYGRRIRLGPGKKVQIGIVEGTGNSKTVSNFLNFKVPVENIEGMPGIAVVPNGRYYQMKTDFGLRVNYDGNTAASVIVPGEYAGMLCGICGNYNGNKRDDATDADGNLVNCGGGKCRNPKLGNSFQVADFDAPKGCKKAEAPPECAPAKDKKFRAKCSLMTSEDGPFKNCLAELNAEVLAQLVDECTFDMCVMDDPEAEMCAAFAKLVKLCSQDTSGWREAAGCPEVKCPKDMTFSYSAPACPNTCEDPQAEEMCADEDVEGCACAEGMLMQGDACVSPEQCGCVREDSGQSYAIGESYLSDDCLKNFKCTAAGTFDEQPENGACVDNASCRLKDGIQGCFCNDGFKGNGVENCEKINPCTEPRDSELADKCSEDADCSEADPAEDKKGYTCKCKDGFEGDGEVCTKTETTTEKAEPPCKKGFGGSDCQPCGPGTFKDKEGNGDCSPCGPGRSTTKEAATDESACVCDVGFGGKECNPCAVGSYSDSVDSEDCKKCGPGETTAAEGADSEKECTCGPGYGGFSDENGGIECRECEEDKYSSSVNFDPCASCPDGSSTEGKKASMDPADCKEPPTEAPEKEELACFECTDSFAENCAQADFCTGETSCFVEFEVTDGPEPTLVNAGCRPKEECIPAPAEDPCWSGVPSDTMCTTCCESPFCNVPPQIFKQTPPPEPEILPSDVPTEGPDVLTTDETDDGKSGGLPPQGTTEEPDDGKSGGLPPPGPPGTTEEPEGPGVNPTDAPEGPGVNPSDAPAPPCQADNDCDKNAQCISGVCKCNEGFAGNGANCVETCSCRIRGDPILDFYDSQYCILPPTPKDKKFLLTKYRMNEDDPCSLMVEVQTTLAEVKGELLQGANMPRYIDVWFGGEILRFDQQMQLSVGGKDVALPYKGQKFNVLKTGNFVVLDAEECGIQVGFEGNGLTSIATIRVPGEYGPELTGMCGNCDGTPNDLRTADGTDVTDDPKKCELIANSYVADDSKDAGFPGL